MSISPVAAKMHSLKQNGLNVIFTKLELEHNLPPVLKLLWENYQKTEWYYNTLSAVKETIDRSYSIDNIREDGVTLKINIISSARHSWLGKPGPIDEIDDDDINGQVIIEKSAFIKECACFSPMSPEPMINQVGISNNILNSRGILALLSAYSAELYKLDFRIYYFSLTDDCFRLYLKKDDVGVRIVIFIKDLKRNEYFID